MPDKPPLAHNLIGLKDIDFAKSSKSTCYHCNTKIAMGSCRFMYRFKASMSMQHLRYVHAECVHQLPEPNEDFKPFLRRLLSSEPDLVRGAIILDVMSKLG